MMKTNNLLNNNEISNISIFINKIALISCWIALILDVVYCMYSNNILKAFLISFFTPIRYFFFDIDSKKIHKRPISLDRNIPLYILMHYWNICFPIPQGNFLADVAGIILSSGRIYINGYGLLLFDTFTFAYKNNQKDFKLDDTIQTPHNNNEIKKVEKEVWTESNNATHTLSKLIDEWKQNQVINDLDIWNFPIKRYIGVSKFTYFQNREIGHSFIDDKYLLDMDKYIKDHPKDIHYHT